MKTIRALPTLQHAAATAAAITCLLLLPVLAEAQLTFTNLHSFSVFPNGSIPLAGLVQGSNGNFYGTTSSGGTNGGGYGAVFEVTTNGVATVLYEFTGGADGANPQAGLVLGNDGNFYGTTQNGGANGNYGTVFKITPDGSLTTLYSFSGSDGSQPCAALVPGSDGSFYGTTQTGGNNNNDGTVFQITTNGQFTNLYEFGSVQQPDVTSKTNVYPCGITNISYSTNQIPLDGATPNGLILGLDGNLYGTTQTGGPGNYGNVFEIMTNGAFTNVYSFTGGFDGANPQAALVQGTNGGLYGTTYKGGSNNSGTVFKIKADGTFTNLYSFTGGFDGANPQAALVHGMNGGFYGTTAYGGTNGYGNVFKVTTNGVLTSLYSFTGGNDGANPQAALAQTSDGIFYGTASGGGAGIGSGGNGTVFKIATDGAFTALYAFPGVNDGQYANAMIHGSDGNFYGTAYNGGTNGVNGLNGSVFKITPNGALTSLYSFTNGIDGANPLAALVQGSDGNFYGTAQNGGDNGWGAIFKITPNGTLTSLYSFTGGNDGANPQVALVQGGGGGFYGTTQYGGVNGYGNVFKITTNGQFRTLYSFGSVEQFFNVTSYTNVTPCGSTISYSTNYIPLDGATPNGLVLGLDGNFYGTTSGGGAYGGLNGNGTVFEITPNGAFTSLYSFTGGNDGANPSTSLVQGGDGNFYGSTTQGGTNGYGTVFQVTPNGSLTTLYPFTGDIDGYSPGSLLAGTDGNFYGTTQYGGTNNYNGNVFQIMTNGSFTNLYSFTGSYDGGSPSTALVQGSDGSLYGTTSSGAVGGDGGVFRLSGSGLPSPLPLITIQPSNPPPTLAGLSATFTVVALGGTPLSYQWSNNRGPLATSGDFSGVNLGILTVDPVSSNDAGTYSVVVSNSYGVGASSNAVLTVLANTNAPDYFEAGTNYMAIADFVLANLSFSNALTFSPTNGAYDFFYAATGLLSLPQEPAGSNFLDHIGLSDIGRDFFDWQARLTNAVPIGVNADEFTAQLRTNVLPAIIAAQSNLARITATNFTVDLTASETHMGAVAVDWGDVQLLRATCAAAELFIYTTYSWNLDVQLTTASNYLGKDGSVEAFLTNFPNLLTTTSANDLPAAQGAFTNAINEYFAASQFIRNRSPGDTFLFNLSTNELAKELQFRQTLSNLLASLNSPVVVFKNSPGNLVSMQAFFNGNFNPRSYLPEFQGDDFVWDTFPDTTFGGIVTGLTEKQVGKGFLKHAESVLDLPGTSLSVLYNFTNFSGQTGVVQGPDGTLYGTMAFGGPFVDLDQDNGFGFGSVFKVTTNGQFSTLYVFGSVEQTNVTSSPNGLVGTNYYTNYVQLDGAYPNALVLGSDGNLYGTTQSGGLSYFTNTVVYNNGGDSSTNISIVTNSSIGGTVFKMTTNGQLTTLYNFDTDGDLGANTPVAALVEGSDGRFYGTTEHGGGDNPDGVYGPGEGTVFAISTNGAFTLLHAFTVIPGVAEYYYSAFPTGENPSAPLVQGSDGNFYGIASSGGIVGTNVTTTPGTTNLQTNIISGYGTIFQITPSGQFSLLHTFGTQTNVNGDPSDGATPNTLVQGADGNFYGTTQYGGANDDSIFQNGYFFGGYGSGDGTLFRFSPANAGSFTNLLSFDENFLDGYYPIGSLVPGPGGVFYGVASAGGANQRGAVFIFNATNGAATNLVWLTRSSGSYGGNLQSSINNFRYYGQPFSLPSLLTLGVDGSLYGTTTDDGDNGSGTIYKLSLAGTAPAIAIQPASQAVRAGSNVTFSVAASGSSPLNYRWFFNSNALFNAGNISGADSYLLALTDISASDAGSYWVIVSNAYGSATSSIATLDVWFSPSIVTNPVSQLGSSATFTVVADGTPPLSYQWQLDDANIPGATNSSFTATSAGTYVVIVTNLYGSVTSAPAELTTEGTGTASRPSVTISFPASGGRTTNLVTGKATGPNGIWNVFYTLTNLNQGTNVISGQAALTTGLTTNSMLWTITNGILPGTNIIAVHAEDLSGKSSAIVTRRFFNVESAPLDLIITGTGAGAFLPIKAFVAGEKPTTNALNIGQEYQITAKPAADCLFGGWTKATPSSSTSTNKDSITFVMESDLTLTADFETNIYIAAHGAYNGLFMVSNSVAAVTEDTAGMLSGLVVRTNGDYSGKLLFQGASYSVAGAFDGFGKATNKLPPARNPVWLVMTLSTNPPSISGSVFNTNTNNGTWTASLQADRATNALPSAQYTMLIPPDTNNEPPNTSPGGDGYALITNYAGTAGNPAAATAKITGALADGAAFSQTVPVSQTGLVPIYANLYSGKGLLLGWVNLDLTNTDAVGVSGLTWIHPARSTGLYQKGFTNVLLTNQILLSLWTNLPENSALTNLTNLSLLDTINATNGESFAVTTTAGGKVAGTSVSGSITPKTGLLKVTIGSGASKVTGYGAILLNPTNGGGNYGGGYYLTKTNNAQAIKLVP